jgi:hypothetical protein
MLDKYTTTLIASSVLFSVIVVMGVLYAVPGIVKPPQEVAYVFDILKYKGTKNKPTDQELYQYIRQITAGSPVFIRDALISGRAVDVTEDVFRHFRLNGQDYDSAMLDFVETFEIPKRKSPSFELPSRLVP